MTTASGTCTCTLELMDPDDPECKDFTLDFAFQLPGGSRFTFIAMEPKEASFESWYELTTGVSGVYCGNGEINSNESGEMVFDSISETSGVCCSFTIQVSAVAPALRATLREAKANNLF